MRDLWYRISKSRKKRPVPSGWATPNDVASLSTATIGKDRLSQPSAMVVGGGRAVVGSRQGEVFVQSLETGTLDRTLHAGEPVSDVIWFETQIAVATSKGFVTVFTDDAEPETVQGHAGSIAGLALHPGGRLFASVGADKGFVFYDLAAARRVFRAYTDSGKWPKKISRWLGHFLRRTTLLAVRLH